jgi:hypothetical protein
MSFAEVMPAQTCAPPPSFVDIRAPAIAPAEQLASHTEEITVDRPLAVVMSVASETSLKDTIRKASSLPGVIGDYPLNNISFVRRAAKSS